MGMLPITKGMRKYEILDKEVMGLMLGAEKKYRSGKIGYAWSLKLVEAACHVGYWRAQRSNIVNHCQDNAQLKDLKKELKITEQYSTVNEINK
eukprot:7934289-Ditylum_brightwellii.AAC.2